MLRTTTHGQLVDLLTELGFTTEVIDCRAVLYRHKRSGSQFLLHNVPPDTPAREGDYLHIRSQLYWWGLMERDEFEEHFALLFAEAYHARTKKE